MMGTLVRLVAVIFAGGVAIAYASPPMPPAIPLCKGPTIVTAIDDPKGLYDNLLTPLIEKAANGIVTTATAAAR